jgi:hypothetical protein
MITACAVVSLALFFSVKREIRESELRRNRAEKESAEALAALAQRVAELEQVPAEPVIAGPNLTPGMNMTKRTQALRRMRQGEGPEQVAAALNLPLKEVKLLAKVNYILTGLDRAALAGRK